MSFEEAFSFGSKQRPVIFPNMGFQRQLTEFERLLHVKRQFSVPKQIGKGRPAQRDLQHVTKHGNWQFNSINAKGTGHDNDNTKIMRQVQAVLNRKNNRQMNDLAAYQDQPVR